MVALNPRKFAAIVMLLVVQIPLRAKHASAFVAPCPQSRMRHIKTTPLSTTLPTAALRKLLVYHGRHSTELSATTYSVPAILAWVPWKQVGTGLVTIPNKWVLYFTCFIACHSQIAWPLAYINRKKSTAQITLATMMVSMLKIMFGPPWASFLVMCYSLGLFIWADFASSDGGPPLPSFVFTVTSIMAFLASLSAMGVFPNLSHFN